MGKRDGIINAVAAHLLAHGFRHAGLRALARSAGTSDRMVMYYFTNKEELITAALMKLAADLMADLELALPSRRASAAQIKESLLLAAKQPDIEATLRLWFEIVGLGMRDEGPYAATARLILDGWQAWIADKLGPARAHNANDLLAQIEGELLLGLLRS